MLYQPRKTCKISFIFGTQMKIFLIKFERWITATLLRDSNLTAKKVNEENV